jgi:hypothetical protein
VEWVKVEHPFTALSPASDVHANHGGSAKQCVKAVFECLSATTESVCQTSRGVTTVLSVQRLVHNWVRPHWGLEKKVTPAMAMGYCNRPISVHEILTQRGFSSLIH